MNKDRCNKVIFALREINRKLEDLKDDAGHVHYPSRQYLEDAINSLNEVVFVCQKERTRE